MAESEPEQHSAATQASSSWRTTHYQTLTRDSLSQAPYSDISTPTQSADEELLLSSTKRPIRRNRQLPLRYRDVIPEPSAALPPTGTQEVPNQNPEANTPVAGILPHLRRLLRSPWNIFGLFRQYHAEDFPSHDPEENVTPEDLSDIPNCCTDDPKLHPTQPSLWPYPNLSSFRLGEWYWNNGAQKSQTSFKELVDIVSDPDFYSSDIRGTRWDLINQQLGCGDGEEEDWAEEDAGWTQTPVTISVPFHRFTDHPGSRPYVVEDFHHRSLIKIIKERLAGDRDHRDFHFEPYELHWKRDGADTTRVHGEIYTSPAFIDAHNQLQDSPLEPGCALPWVVVALMFASDATHLSSFGDAKLWPLYLFFGNESKYLLCKPSCHLCHHVVYFQKVCGI